MKSLLLLIALCLAGACCARAQFSSFGDLPIEITSDSTRMENGVAIAEHNVLIRYGDTAIYCDYGQYHPETREVYLSGNVRIYRENRLFTAERALYNLETKILSTSDFVGESLPFRFGGETLSTLGPNGYLVKGGIFTTSDSSKPDYTIRAKTVRIYPKDRIIFSNVYLYVGRVPIFWYPYLYQSLNQDTSFSFTPGYSSTLGAYLLNQYSFPLTPEIAGRARLDLYSTRGVGAGLEGSWGRFKRSAASLGGSVESAVPSPAQSAAAQAEEKRTKNFGRFLSYFIDDAKPGTNNTALAREKINPTRYRISLQDRTYLAEDIYSTININKLSDRLFLQDFAPDEFRTNPNPDNIVALTKWDEDYTAVVLARRQINSLFDATERQPEFALDIKRQQLFHSPVFYDGESSAGEYRRAYAKDSTLLDYQAFRADTFHQFSLPGTYFGWLSIVPHVGGRLTYYEASSPTESVLDPLTGTVLTTPRDAGAVFRAAFNANLEASFKASRAYEGVQSRMLGLDGLRHVVQPYMNASFVRVNKNPADLLQFDQFNRSTEPQPLDFPQFNTMDGLDNWSIVRLGVRNRLQTRRDDQTINWMELDTFADVNIDRPNFGSAVALSDTGTFSNLYNRLTLQPLPWFYYRLDSQLPVFDAGFTQVNSDLAFMPNKEMTLSIGQRFIWGNKQFPDSNLFNVSGYLRLNDNWGVSASESYEFATGILQSQSYQIHRDLSSWVAGLGFSVLNNGGKEQITFILTFTVKDAPMLRTPFNYTPSIANGSNGSP